VVAMGVTVGLLGVAGCSRAEEPKDVTGWFVSYRSTWHFTPEYLNRDSTGFSRREFAGLQTNTGIVAIPGQPFQDRQSCEVEAKKLNDHDTEFKGKMAKLGASADLVEGIHTVSSTHFCTYTTATRKGPTGRTPKTYFWDEAKKK